MRSRRHDDFGFGDSERLAATSRLYRSDLRHRPSEDSFRQGTVERKGRNEELTLEMMNAGPEDRLACVARIAGDVIVEVLE